MRGAPERLVPILMTALALLPLAVTSGAAGNEIEGPMAIVILGGLVTSTALNLIVPPTLALRHGRFDRDARDAARRARRAARMSDDADDPIRLLAYDECVAGRSGRFCCLSSMDTHMHAWLASISAHPHVVLAVVFAAACAESVAVVGTIVPAGAIMFVAGALIGAGALDGWVTLGIAALGAIAGDGLSYELGRRYRAEVRAWSHAKGHQAAWTRGEQFVQRHGGKSIALARFFAPVRAIVPLVAGAARMERRRFYPINVASALAWAPAHIAPGIVFGASAALAEAVSARAAVMLIVVAALAWAVVALVRLTIRRGLPLAGKFAERLAQRVAARATRRFPRAAQRMRRAIGSSDRELPMLAALALLFVGSIWLFAGVLQDIVANDPLMRADTALFAFLQSLRTAPVDTVMAAVAALNGRAAGIAVAATVLAWLVARRCWRTAVWWVIVIGVAVVLTPAPGTMSGAAAPLAWRPGLPHAPLPDGQAAFAALAYCGLGWMLARRQSSAWSSGVAATIALWIALGGFADLYLGRAWLSGLLGGWSLGLAWFAVLAGTHAYRRIDDAVWPTTLAPLVAGALAVAGWWAVPANLPPPDAGWADARPVASFTPQQWLDAGWRRLPARRADLGGERNEPLPLQWPAQGAQIARDLEEAGWRAAPAWSMDSAMRPLLPQVRADQLPVLPKFSEGESSRLAFVRVDPQHTANRLVLRLWRSHYAVRDAGIDTPLWFGALYGETLYRPVHLMTLAASRNVDDTADIAAALSAAARTVTHSARGDDGSVRRAVLILPAGLAAPLDATPGSASGTASGASGPPSHRE